MIVDPFISSHRVIENDNAQIDVAARAGRRSSRHTDCAADLVHHSRKTGGAEVTVEDGRGASSLGAKVRAVRTLNVMSEDEAARAGVKERRAYFRVDGGKGNNRRLRAPPIGTNSDPSTSPTGGDGKPGDSVGVVTKWAWPDHFDGVTVTDLRKAQAAMAVGGPWRESPQAKNWAGNAVAMAMGLDPTNKATGRKSPGSSRHGPRRACSRQSRARNSKRMKRNFIEVGEPANG